MGLLLTVGVPRCRLPGADRLCKASEQNKLTVPRGGAGRGRACCPRGRAGS